MKDRVYTIEIYGENNSFKVEAIADYEPCEDWLTGKVTYQTCLDSVKLVHGNRRREVLPILTEEQQKHIVKQIDESNLYEYNSWLEGQAEYSTMGA